MSRTVKIISWNVNGVRSAHKKGLLDWIKIESPDILCIQETKAHEAQLAPELAAPEGYFAYWCSAQRKGYSGVAVFSKEKPLHVSMSLGSERFDSEGRLIRLDFEHFILFNVYFPNGGMGPERLQFKMDFYDAFLEMLQELRKTHARLVIVGDVNTAHNEIDIARPKQNVKTSGFLPIERAWMDKFVGHGYVDTFRKRFPDTVQYTWWDMKSGARQRNIGWRLDYVFVTEEMAHCAGEPFASPDVMGSDHCPVGIILELE